MNKVTNFEIAGQVFSIEDKAFDVLNAYIKRIRAQLGKDESFAVSVNSA